MRRIFLQETHAPLARIDVRLKLVLGFCMSILVILADSIFLLGALACAGLFLCVSAKPNRSQWKLIAISAAFLVWGLMFSQGLFYNKYPRTIFIQILPPGAIFSQGLNVYYQGIHYGLVQSLRLLAVLFTGYAVCFTTSPDQFFRGLTAMRVPFSLAFMAVTAIRFIPLVAQEFATVRAAMRLKGYRPFRHGLRDTLMTEVAGLRPILAGTIRRSEEVALTIITRGFDLKGSRTSLHEERLSAGGWTGIAFVFILTLFLTSCKTLFWFYQLQIFYHPALRWTYHIARNWL